MRSWHIADDFLGPAPRPARAANPTFVPPAWELAKTHQALFWMAIINLPFGPFLALVGWAQGETYLAAGAGIVGSLPSIVGFLLAFRLDPGEPASVDALRSWTLASAKVTGIEEHAPDGQADSYRKSPGNGAGNRAAAYQYEDTEGTKHEGRVQLRASDPPLGPGDTISVLIAPEEPSKHRVLRRMGDAMLPGSPP